MSIFAPSLASLVKLIEASGLNPEAFMAEEGLDPSIIFDANARLPVEAAERISWRARKAARDPFFALREWEHLQAGHLGPLGFAWLASPTLRSALGRLNRFEAMVNDHLSVSMQERGDTLAVTIEFHNEPVDAGLREDSALGILVAMCRRIAGEDLNPTAVYCQQATPEDTSEYFALFRCPVHFDAETTRMEFPRDAVDEPLTGCNQQVAASSDEMAIRYLAWRDRNDIVNRVRTWIIEHLAEGHVTEDRAAEALAMSTRSLNRKLREEDTSFKQVLNDTRRSLAERLITDPSLSLTEISFMLGFSEASSFSRAFKRWTGNSPSEVRNA